MAEGMSQALAIRWLNYIFNNTAPTAITAVWIKLHVGAPGGAGTANPATETTRQSLSAATATDNTATSDAVLTWTNIAGSQDSTHWSAWDDQTAGTFLGSGTISANAYVAGDTYNVPVGDFDITIPIAS